MSRIGDRHYPCYDVVKGVKRYHDRHFIHMEEREYDRIVKCPVCGTLWVVRVRRSVISERRGRDIWHMTWERAFEGDVIDAS